MGDSLLIKAIAQASGRTPDKVKRDFKDHGDLGDVAMASRGKQGMLSFGAKPKPLTVRAPLARPRGALAGGGGAEALSRGARPAGRCRRCSRT